MHRCVLITLTASAVLLGQGAATAQERVPMRPTAVEKATDPGTPLTLGVCIERALALGLEMRIQAQSLDIARSEVPIAKSEFYPVLSASTGRSTTRTPDFSLDATAPVIHDSETDSRIGLIQKLPTGTLLSFDVNLNRSAITPAQVTLNPAYSSDMTLGVSQPLLKGFGTNATLLPLRRAEAARTLAEHLYRDRALDVIQATQNAYYQLAAARRQQEVFAIGERLAQKFLAQVEARREAGMAIKLDLLQAQVGVANASLKSLKAEAAVRAREDALRVLIGDFKFNTPLSSALLDAEEDAPTPTVEGAYALALARSPALASAHSTLDVAKIDLSSAEDNLKPSLNLDLALNRNGIDRSGRSAFSSTLAGDGNTWQAGLSITYPLGRIAEKGRWQQASATVRQQSLRVEQLEENILAAVRDAVRQIDTTRSSLALAKLTEGVAEKQYEAQVDVYQIGRATSREVLQAQSDLENARVASLQARLDLLSARAALERLEGSALDHYAVTLPTADIY